MEHPNMLCDPSAEASVLLVTLADSLVSGKLQAYCPVPASPLRPAPSLESIGTTSVTLWPERTAAGQAHGSEDPGLLPSANTPGAKEQAETAWSCRCSPGFHSLEEKEVEVQEGRGAAQGRQGGQGNRGQQLLLPQPAVRGRLLTLTRS